MKVVLVRVDDRLIHGQVVVGWSRAVRATHILVADDDVAKDSAQKTLMKLAAPPGVKVTVLPVVEAAGALAGDSFRNDNVMVLVRSPLALLTLIKSGLKLTRVNVGNVRAAPGRERLTKEVAATPEEIEAWKQLDQAGVVLEAVWLPGGAVTNFNNVIRARTAHLHTDGSEQK